MAPQDVSLPYKVQTDLDILCNVTMLFSVASFMYRVMLRCIAVYNDYVSTVHTVLIESHQCALFSTYCSNYKL